MDSRFKTWFTTSVVILSAALFAGCDGKKTTPKTDDQKTPKTEPVTKTDGETPEVPKPAVKPKPFVPPTTVTLKDVTPEQLQAEIAKHKGHVVLVDYWFVNCQPCRKAFPHTVAMSKKHAKDGLVLITMCVEIFEKRAEALKFLQSKDAKLINLFTSEKVDPDTAGEKFEVGSFPTYRLYGADGKFLQALTPDGPDAEAFQKKLDAAVLTALGVR